MLTRSRLTGVLIGAIGSACYGLNPLFTLPLYHEGLSPAATLFLRYALALAMAVPLLARFKKPFRLAPREVLPVLGLGVLFAASSETLFDAYLYMDVGIASTLLFVYPVLVAVMMSLFFRERFAWQTLASVTLVGVGIALLNHSAAGASLNPTGFGLVMVSALTYALYIIGVNRPRLRNVDGMTIIFYSLAVGTALYGFQALLAGHLTLPKAPLGWGCAAGLALVPTILAVIGTTLSIRLIGPTPAAVLGALEPVSAVLVGTLAFGERLTPRILLGIVLILAAVTLIVYARHEKQQH